MSRMINFYMLFCLVNLALASEVNINQKSEVTLDQDPSLFPGHMEPLGAKQPRTEIEELTEYPSPEDFFENYIKPGRPFLLKKGAVDQRAYKLWTDEYMSSFPEAAEELVQCEPNKKENREAQGFEIPLKEFISRYHNESLYMVNKVPTFLQKDILMPSPLRCNNTRKLMLDHVTWMSSGGTKSVLHNDDLDNINCLFRGEKELVFIDLKYRDKVPIDKPNGGYSSLDVDKVNFTKFPTLREVEYIHCKMEQGDCLFIPWQWFHQVNSVANENQQNIAVNIWFTHDPDHKPAGCNVPDDQASINNWKFIGMEGASDPASSPLFYLQQLLKKTKYKRANLKTFLSLITRIPGVIADVPLISLPILDKDELVVLVKELFNIINVNKDKYFNEDDLDMIFSDETLSKKLHDMLAGQFKKIEKFIQSNLPSEMEDESDEDEEDTTINTATSTDQGSDDDADKKEKTEL